MPTDPETTKAVVDSLSLVVDKAYEDLVRPSAKRVGSAVETLFKVGLSPLALLDAGFEASKTWLQGKIQQRVAEIPDECVTAPPSNITIPALLQIASAADAPELRDLYAELLLKSLDSRTASTIHPAYVGLISQLRPEEAYAFVAIHERGDGTLLADWTSSDSQKRPPPSIEMQFRESCKRLGVHSFEQSQIYLDNLMRLGLYQLKERTSSDFTPGDNNPFGERVGSVETRQARELSLSAFGRAFWHACAPPNHAPPA
jgi:hypothetical protein